MVLSQLIKNMELSLDETVKAQYFGLLKRMFSFNSAMTRIQYLTEIQGLLTTQEQNSRHNALVQEMLKKINEPTFRMIENLQEDFDKSPSEIGSFQMPEASPLCAPSILPSDFENRSAASELFLPDSGFMAMRINLNAWENKMEGVQDGVTELMVKACQIFVKNIITAMISRKRGYKVRDGKFQYGFSVPVPDPFVRNTNNIIDNSEEKKVDITQDENGLVPKLLPTLENAQHQKAFAYSCAKRKKSDNILSVRLLYDTIRDNPNLIGLHSVHSINLLKLGLQIED